LELALQTAVDGGEANCGRLSVRETPDQSLAEFGSAGSLVGFEAAVHQAERQALNTRGIGEAKIEDRYVASVALGLIDETQRAHGVITVGREGRPFTDDDRDLLRSLASQTTLALENVELHYQVQRQAVTDELTGLANHGHFQELLSAESEQVRRYEHPVGLIMLDIDNFKLVNDTYGHPQGDVVLKHVARVLRQNSRDVDSPARYGGEEMALILPHTDLPGSHAIAERVRTAIEALHIPRLDSDGVLRVTASLGVAASTDGDKETLIAEADAALYSAKRGGKNRTVAAQAANVVGGE
jgi:diguanylate cyclase (GGDEF)-like protein